MFFNDCSRLSFRFRLPFEGMVAWQSVLPDVSGFLFFFLRFGFARETIALCSWMKW